MFRFSHETFQAAVDKLKNHGELVDSLKNGDIINGHHSAGRMHKLPIVVLIF